MSYCEIVMIRQVVEMSVWHLAATVWCETDCLPHTVCNTNMGNVPCHDVQDCYSRAPSYYPERWTAC